MQRAASKAGQNGSTLPADAETSLSTLRVNFLHLNGAMVRLQEMLASPGGDMPDWPTLVSTYNALLSQVQGIAVQLGKPPDAEQSQRELERHLARVVPHPVRPVDFARDVELANLVLNTAAPSMQEEADRRSVLDDLPDELRVKNSEDYSEVLRVADRVQQAVAQHDRLAAFARRRVGAISGLDRGDSDDEGDDDDEAYAANDTQEYDWKMRLDLEQQKGASAAQQTATLQEWAKILKDGR